MQPAVLGTLGQGPAASFVFEIQGSSFELPLESGGTYDFHVDWGDSSSDDITVWNDAAVDHTYAGSGTYDIEITGTIIGWRFGGFGNAHREKIYDISSWGPLRLGNNGSYFYACTNLTVSATDVLDLTGTTDLGNAFRSCDALTTVPSMDSWDVSNATTMASMFKHSDLFNQAIGSWDVSSVTEMGGMFANAFAFNQDISSWNVSSVIYMNDVFSFNFGSTPAFNQDISGWNVSNVITMEAMFDNAIAFDQNLGTWDITSVTNMDSMFDTVTLSTVNYDAILIGWEAQVVQDSVDFYAGNSKYSAGAAATARQALIDDHWWTISDGGQV